MSNEEIKSQEVAELNKYQQVGLQLKSEAEAMEIVSADDLLQANVLLKKCNTLEKELEEERKGITDPVNERVKRIIAKAKELIAPTNEAKEIVKEKILAYNARMEQIRIAEQNKIAEENRKFQEEQDKIAKEAQEEADRVANEAKEKLENTELTEEEKQAIQDEKEIADFNAEKAIQETAEANKKAQDEAQMRQDAMAANAQANKPK